MAQRTGDLFAYAAKDDGKVISVTETGIVVEYKDGTRRGVELGRRYGASAGLTIPHSVVANVKEGQVFKKGHVLTYNPGFFEVDPSEPWNVNWKTAVLVTTALMESADTLEDSAAISANVAGMLSTSITKQKDVIVRFDQHIRNLVKEGQEVDNDDILCYIEDAITADNNLFDEESLDTLRLMGSQAPLAKAHGKVERIEVYYHGELEDMSDSMRAIAKASDKNFAARSKSQGKTAYTGSVDEGFRIEGNPLLLDTMAVRVYITGDVTAGVGDKGVFCNQMKTVFGRVFRESIKTESGKEVDAIFGRNSIASRIVNSPDIIGTTNTLLELIAKKAVEIYGK